MTLTIEAKRVPLLSVLIPAFNAARHLESTLDALVNELPGRIEVIACDDGSTDATLRVAQRYAKSYPWVRCAQQANAGAAAARNSAFRASSGRWVLFFDADDLCSPGSLDGMLQVAIEHPQDVVYCTWAKFDADASLVAPGPVLAAETLPGWEWLRRAFSTDYPTYTGSFLLPRALVERVGPWDERLGFQDDMEFFARAISAAPKVRFCPAAQFLYRAGVPGSLSKRGGRRSSESQLLATELASRHLIAARDTPETRTAAARQLMLVSYAQYLWAPDLSTRAEALASELTPGGLRRPWLPGGIARRVLQLTLGWKRALRVHARLRSLVS